MNLLQCHALEKRYANKRALENVELNLESGHIVGLLGPNGSGKTTLIKLCAGLLTPTNGEILINGMRPCTETKALVSYLPERNALPLWMRTEEVVRYYADFFADFRSDAAMQMIAQLGLDLKQRIRTMSKGTREKLQLILTMSRRAKLYLLDEPIGGVDPATRDYILHTILSNFDGQSTIVISTHLIADVEQILDQVVFLRNGQIALFDTVDNIRSERQTSVDALFREVFKCFEN